MNQYGTRQARATGKDSLLNALVSLLREVRNHSRGDRTTLQMVVHQLGHTPLYVPAYMAIEQLVDKCKDSDAGTSWLSVRYEAARDDAEALSQVLHQVPWKVGEEPCLHLGLSEIYGRDSPDILSSLVERPFVKRLPLWGVALRNNWKINALRKRLTEGHIAFWKLFSGKMSLLRPQDFGPSTLSGTGDAKLSLSLSIYDEGSTAHRVFTTYLRSHEHDSLINDHLKPVALDEDLDLLLEGTVDVALTVQPWRGIRLAHSKNRELEVVYTHLDRPAPITSIYMHRDPDDDVELWQSFVQVLGGVVQYNVEGLYEGRDLKEAYGFYRRAGPHQVDSSPKLENEEDFDFALRLLSDSRVYFYEIDADRSHWNTLANSLGQCLARYFATVAQQDLAFAISSHAASLSPLGIDWHQDDVLSDLRDADNRALDHVEKAFCDFAKTLDVLFDPNEQLTKIRENWCLREPASVLTFLDEEKNKGVKCPTDPWRVRIDKTTGRRHNHGEADSRHVQVDFGPWIPRKALTDAFKHLNDQFVRKDGGLTVLEIKADVLFLGIPFGDDWESSCYEGLSWLWLEYVPDKFGPTPSNKFMDQWQVGDTFLNAWHVHDGNENLITHIFKRKDHGVFELKENRILCLRANQQEVAISKHVPGRDGLLFTFKVAGVRLL